MNPNQPSREEIEAKLTALLLGELPAEEARLLRWTISQDAELKKLHDELAAIIVLVREVQKTPAEASAEKAPAIKLSAERRTKLLAHFQTPRPQPKEPLFWLKRIEMPRLVTVLAVVALVAVVAAMLLPSLAAAKKKAQRMTMLSGERMNETKEQAAPAGLEYRTWGADNSYPEQTAAPAPPISAPVTVTVVSAPVLAPPPAPIYLPTTPEAPGQELAANGQKNFGAFQGVVGDGSVTRETYGATMPATPGAGALDSTLQEAPPSQQPQSGSFAFGINAPADRGAALSDKPADYEGKKQNQFYRDRIAGGSGGGGGGAGDTFERANTVNSYALNGAVGASSTLGMPYPAPQRTEDFSKTEAGKSGFAAAEMPASSPVPTFGSTSLEWESSDMNRSGVANLGEESRRQVASSGAIADHGVILPGAAAGVPQQKLPEVALDGGAGESSAAYKLKSDSSDQLVTGRLRGFYDDDVSAGNKAYQTSRPTVSTINGRVIASTPPVMTTAPVKLDLAAGSQPALATGGISRLDEFEGMLKSGGGALVPGGAIAATVTNSIASSDQFYQGLAKDDVGGVRHAVIDPATGLPATSKLSNADRQSYEDAKNKLGQMVELHKLLGAKISAEQANASIPKTSMVQLVDQAEPNEKQSFWQGVKGEYQSKARMKVENDVMDSPGNANSMTASMMPYDPYFIQTTFEVIQSDAVLGRVVDSLNLESAWSAGNGGQKLTKKQAIQQLKSQLALKPIKNTKLIEISATSSKPEEAAKIANAVAEAYKNYRVVNYQETTAKGLAVLQQQYATEETQLRELRAKVESAEPKAIVESNDQPLPKLAPNTPIPQPEYLCRENNFSTFSLNVSDVSFKLAAASLERGQMPEAASIRSEEFINAFDYRDPEAAAGQPLAFTAERARYAFAQNRDLLRFSVKTAAAGRQAGRALNLVLLLDNSGSMERADRVAIIREALRVLATQLQPQDTVSVVTFARTARLWADGVHGDQAGETLNRVGGITPEGGTNLEEAVKLAYETAHRHYLANGMNRVVLLTDGAANLGDVNPADLKQKVEAQRKQGIALDCFGIGSQDFNDDLLEQLSRNGDGRYAFLNSTDDAANEFAAKLAGALQVAASDVKVQVEFNPQRVVSWRQIGYAKHQLTKEQFRDNTVDAAEIAAQEAGNALYTVETKADGVGPIATVRVRYKVPGTTDYRERSWDVPYEGSAASLAQASAAMRLAATAGAFSEWLAASPFAQEVTPDELLKTLSGVPQVYGADQRPQKLEWMIHQAKSVAGQ